MPLPIFNSLPQITYARNIPDQWDYVERSILSNLNITIDYYRNAIPPTMGGHILLKIINSFGIPFHYELNKFYEQVQANAHSVAMSLRLSNYASPGVDFGGVFYGQIGQEFLLATSRYHSCDYIHDNWKTITSVNPLLIPHENISFHIPNGKVFTPNKGLAVIEIDIVTLMVQARAFYLEQIRKPHEQRHGFREFIYNHILPNMIPYQLELMLMNKLIMKYEQRYEIEYKPPKLPFTLKNIDFYIDSNLDKVLHILNIINEEPNSILQNITGFNSHTSDVNLLMPDIMTTQQIDWLLIATRLKYFSFLMKIAINNKYRGAQDIWNKAARNIKLYNGHKEMREHLFLPIMNEVDTYLKIISEQTNVKFDEL